MAYSVAPYFTTVCAYVVGGVAQPSASAQPFQFSPTPADSSSQHPRPTRGSDSWVAASEPWNPFVFPFPAPGLQALLMGVQV